MKRIKKIIVCLVAVLLLCGCFPNSSQAKTTDIEEKPTGTFIEIERGVTYKIVYHRDSKVMYVVSGAYTQLVNADGTPMLYEG